MSCKKAKTPLKYIIFNYASNRFSKFLLYGLKCEDCGKEFVFSTGEQEFYAEKGLVNKPKRCPECRKERRQKNRRRMHEAVCSQCGAKTKVPFKPIEGKEIYCKECYQKRQSELNV